MTLREAVYRSDGGQCIQCHLLLAPSGNAWQWQAHHVLKRAWMERFDADRSDHNLAVLLCRRCHERHENRTCAVSLERLPMRARTAVAALGDAAEDLLRRYHPPTELDAA